MPEAKLCDYCSRPIEPDELTAKRAPHQRFCSKDCRQKWHSEQYSKAMALLREQEAKQRGGINDR